MDYTALTTELTFDPDNSRRCVSIGLVDDSLLEPSEEFEVSLTTDEEQVTVNPDRAVVTILDTDGMIGLDSLIIFKIIFIFMTAARIGFEMETYSEREPNEVINVTVAVLGGTLSQEVVVRIYSMDSSARCEN